MSRLRAITAIVATGAAAFSCDSFYKDDYRETSPTSGRLKVYYDEGLAPHAKNQAFTFESQYQHVRLELTQSNDDRSINALLLDSCEAIMVSRLPGEQERRRFQAKMYNPRQSHVATSGVAFIVSDAAPLKVLAAAKLPANLRGEEDPADSAGNPMAVRFLIDRNNSSVMRYLLDSVAKAPGFGKHCSSLGSTEATLEYVARNSSSIGVIDFAWLSDRDDSLYEKYAGRIRFLGIVNAQGDTVYPSQSSFKLNRYPYARKVYVMRKTGEFTLAKGFESFVAGPKGQLTFLKQGLLPARQAERNIEVKIEPLTGE